MSTRIDYERGLKYLGSNVYAYLQPDGSWGWSNAGLIADRGETLLVDTLYDVPKTREMLAAMAEAVPGAANIQRIVNTHANGDHCYGNQAVEGAEIIASKRSAEEMVDMPPKKMALLMTLARGVTSAGPLGRGLASVLNGVGLKVAGGMVEAGPYVAEIFKDFDFANTELVPPTRTFEERLELKVGDKEVHLMEVGPAHTQGDVLVHVPGDSVVFTGDILFIEGHPIVWDGPISNWVNACNAIIEMNAEHIVPGHGPLTDRLGVERMRDYLTYVEGEALARFDAGMTPLDAALDIDLSAYQGWSDSERIVINVDTVYRHKVGGPKRSVMELYGWMSRVRKVHKARGWA